MLTRVFSFLFMVALSVLADWCGKETGQSYDEIRFNPAITYGSVTDIDGNTYRTVQIGTQEWMAENLKTSRFSDGTPVPLVPDSKQWESLYSEGYYVHEKAYRVYGCLYNYYAAASSHKICPSGWHLPDNSDWTVLGIYLGGESFAGKKLKEAGLVHWGDNNTLATNESGFTALPGGLRSHVGGVYSMGNSNGGAGYWWSATVSDSSTAWSYSLGGGDIKVYKTPLTPKRIGQSIRCIRD